MRIVTLILLLVLSLAGFSQSFERNPGESVDSFIARIKPDSSEMAHAVLETTELGTKEKIIIAFFRKTVHEVKQMDTYVDHSSYQYIIGHLYIPTGKNLYQQILIDTTYPEGGAPEIISVFFANADKDKNKELVILCKYEQRHYDVSGAIYETFIYDFVDGDTQYLEISKKFDAYDLWFRDGKREKAKYKTAADVKAALKRMGY